MKNRVTKNQTLNYNIIKSSQFLIFHNNKKVDTMTNEIIKNTLDLQFQNKTLQRKKNA